MIKRRINNLMIRYLYIRKTKTNKKLKRDYGVDLKDIDSIDKELWVDFRKADK